MAEIIKNPTTECFMRWKEGMAEVVGEKNISFGFSETMAHTPYASFIPLPDAEDIDVADMDGDENGIIIGFQTEVYATTNNKAYEYDDASRQIMKSMGFFVLSGRQRFEVKHNLIRIVSRFQMKYYGAFM